MTEEVHLTFRPFHGQEVDLGIVKPETLKIGGQFATVEEVAALMNWEPPYDCEECGHEKA